MRVCVYTLGCKTNQFESQAMEKLLSEKGFEIVPFFSEADAYIINSCTVTATADKKTRQAVARIRRERPGSFVAICGCMAQLAPEKLKKALGVDLVGGNRDHAAFAAEVEKGLLGGDRAGRGGSFERAGFAALPAGGLLGRTRALLKIEDGCDNFCSYCIIPYARGRVRSLPFEDALDEARRLSREGYREIVLTGIEISSYGRDLPGGKGLLELTKAICEAAPCSRVRIGSLKPTVITKEFCEGLSGYENLCRHFHLSVQSGDDDTLKRMNRRYGAADVRNAVRIINSYFENANITADLICGFCGETDTEFENTRALVRECGFTRVHVFPFSVRAGTAAEKMGGSIDKGTAAERCAAISALGRESTEAFLKKQIGKRHTVIFEERTKNGAIGGYTSNYLYAQAKDGGGISRGDMLPVIITGAAGGRLICCADKAE